jgi:cob(I)alamin adenosyltransferase
MNKVKIYTKTGDDGETSLFTGKRVLKNDPFIDALGTVDECNTAIGLAISLMPQERPFDEVREQLETVQHALFDLGAALATPRTSTSAIKLDKTRFDDEEIAMLEFWIDQFTADLAPLTTFILPGGSPCGAALHLARSICRRAERIVIPLQREGDVNKNVVVYLNRLSDYLFVVSRHLNALCKKPETIWEHHKLKS